MEMETEKFYGHEGVRALIDITHGIENAVSPVLVHSLHAGQACIGLYPLGADGKARCLAAWDGRIGP